MKSTGRHHKPVNNELAQWLGEHIEQWKPHLPVIGVVAAVVLVVAIGYLVFSRDDTSSAASWQAYYAAYGEPAAAQKDALKRVAEAKKETAAGRWALLAIADSELQQATQELVQDPKAAKTKLKNAEAMLKEAETGTGDKLLLLRVRSSLAKASESANKLEEARKYYEMVAKGDPDGTLGKSALKALKRLGKGSDVPEMLAWLESQEFEGRPKSTANMFDFDRDPKPLPERPDLSIPGEMKLNGPSPLGPSPLDGLDLKGLPGLDKPLTETPKTETPKTETPAEEPKTKSPSIPKAVKPALPTPVKPAEKASEEKPVGEKKAEDDKPPPAGVKLPDDKKPVEKEPKGGENKDSEGKPEEKKPK